jgi:hypothetical protein
MSKCDKCGYDDHGTGDTAHYCRKLDLQSPVTPDPYSQAASNRRADEQVREVVRNQVLEEAAIACFDIRFAREGFDRTSWNQGVIDCINAIRALQSTTPAEPVENGWLPIESAPVDKEILLTATLHNMLTPKPQRVVGRKDSRGGWWSTCGQTLSHMQCWQPLPPPPYSQRNE